MLENKITDTFLKLVEENKKLIYKVSHMYSDNTTDRKDLFQEIIANLWKAYPDFRHKSKVSTWIYRIALNTSISWFRNYLKSADYIEYTNSIPQISEDQEFEELNAKLFGAIDILGKLDKAIILLQLEGYSYDEISEITGLSKTNVATKINRIKLKLKHHLSNNKMGR